MSSAATTCELRGRARIWQRRADRRVGLLLAVLLGGALGLTRQTLRSAQPIPPHRRASEWNEMARSPERTSPPANDLYFLRYNNVKTVKSDGPPQRLSEI